MKTLICDTETTGISADKDRVIEIACVLFCLEHASVIETYAALLEGTDNAAAHINKIPGTLLEHGSPSEVVWDRVAELMGRADCLLAHNAPFDKGFIEKQIDAIEIPWVCSMRDLDLPEKSDSRKLTEVAIAHGVVILNAHRALTDVDILVRLLQRLHERGIALPALFKEAMVAKPLVQAMVPFERKDEAKAAGFSWNKPEKRWEKRLSLEAAKKLPFRTKVLEA